MAVVTAAEPSAAQRKADAARKAAEAMEETEKAIGAAREQARAGALQGAGARRARDANKYPRARRRAWRARAARDGCMRQGLAGRGGAAGARAPLCAAAGGRPGRRSALACARSSGCPLPAARPLLRSLR